MSLSLSLEISDRLRWGLSYDQWWIQQSFLGGILTNGETSAEDARFLGWSGGILPRKILKIWVSEIAFPAFWENILAENFLDSQNI